MKPLSTLFAILVFSISLFQLRAEPSGLVSRWLAESNTLDSLGGNNGTAVGGVAYAPGVIGSAFSLDGSSFVSVANPTFNAYASGFTVMAWIKIDAYNQAASLINLRDPANSSGFTLENSYNNPGQILWAVNQTGVSEGFSQLLAGGWQPDTFYHVAATFNSASGTMSLYRNGVLIASTNNLPHTSMATVASPVFQIGRNIVNPSFSWDGLIDDVRFYDHALSPSEIASIVGEQQCDWIQGANGHYYKVVAVPNGVSWTNAQLAAQGFGGYLAAITSAEENAFVFSLINNNNALWYVDGAGDGVGPWIGGFQPAGSPEPAGGWSWVDGEPFSYSNWAGGGPNNNGGNECLICFFGLGTLIGAGWNDLPAVNLTHSFVVERDTPPSCSTGAATLLAVSQSGGFYRFIIGPSGPAVALSSVTDASLNAPSGLALSPGGELFVNNRYAPGGGNGSVSRFLNPTGTPVFNGIITNGFNAPHGADFLGNELLVADSWNSRVRRYTFAGNGIASEQTPITEGLAGQAPRYVRVGPGGEVFVSQCNCGGQNDVRRFLINGNTITANGRITGNGINNPHGIAFSAAGEMFVANYDGNSISRFTFSNGVAIANGQITGNGLSQPIGIIFSPWGELFAANGGAAVISRWTFTTNGTAVTNGTLPVPAAVADVAFVSAVGDIPVTPPYCTNLTFTLIPATTNCVYSTNNVCVTNTVVLVPGYTNCFFTTNMVCTTNLVLVTPAMTNCVSVTNTVCVTNTVVLVPATTNCFQVTNIVTLNVTNYDGTNAQTVLNGLNLWWTGDNTLVEKTGNASRSGVPASYFNGLGIFHVPGRIGQAFSFSSNSFSIQGAYGENWSAMTNATEISFSWWQRQRPELGPDVNPALVFQHGTDPFDMGRASNFQLGVKDGKAYVSMAVENSSGAVRNFLISSAQTVSSSEWFHAVFTWRSADGGWALYLNGALDSQGIDTAGIGQHYPKTFQFCQIGTYNNFKNFTTTNLLDDLRAYRRAISPAEITQIYQIDLQSSVTTNYSTDIQTVCTNVPAVTTNVVTCTNLVQEVCTTNAAVYANIVDCTNVVAQTCTNVPAVLTNVVDCADVITTDCTITAAVTTNLDFCTVAAGRLMILPAANRTVNLRWSSQAGAFYLLEATDELVPSSWTTVWGIQAGNGSYVIVPEPTTTKPRRFYRLLSTEP